MFLSRTIQVNANDLRVISLASNVMFCIAVNTRLPFAAQLPFNIHVCTSAKKDKAAFQFRLVEVISTYISTFHPQMPVVVSFIPSRFGRFSFEFLLNSPVTLQRCCQKRYVTLTVFGTSCVLSQTQCTIAHSVRAMALCSCTNGKRLQNRASTCIECKRKDFCLSVFWRLFHLSFRHLFSSFFRLIQ